MNTAMTGALIYLGIGVALSIKAAPLSWQGLIQGQQSIPLDSNASPQKLEQAPVKRSLGNLPFWWLLWPVPVVAQGIKMATGKWPPWTPDL